MIRNYFIVLILLVFQSCKEKSAQIVAKVQSPNILIIHADEHRIDCIGAYGNKDVLTPNLDQLAREGVIYQNPYVSLPVCTPSRYSLISGMDVQDHQAWTNHSTLNPAIETFPDVLKKAGYKTEAIGKMHFAPTYLDVGFEELMLVEQDGPGRWDDDYHRELMRNNLVDKIDLEDQRSEYRKDAPIEYWESFGTKSTGLPDEFYSTNWTANHSVKTIENWDTVGSNLLMVGFIKPHHPFDPPQKWVDMYNPEELELLPGWIEEPMDYDTKQNKGYFENKTLNEKALKKSMAFYYASITQIDYEVGRMIQVLKDKGIYDNTMIIYTSDHGDHMGYHHQILKGGFLYESIMKTPLIIKYPNGEFEGTINNKLISIIDIAPTILNAAGLKIPATMTGHDLTEASISREYVFAHNWLGAQAMARSKNYKLIQNRKGKSLFFDLQNDPLEMNNLYDDENYQDKIKSHYEAVVEWQGMDSVFGENYLDYNAPIINQPNVTTRDDGHREEIIEYYKHKMSESND